MSIKNSYRLRKSNITAAQFMTDADFLLGLYGQPMKNDGNWLVWIGDQEEILVTNEEFHKLYVEDNDDHTTVS